MVRSVRVDKFLWAVRLYKTRTKATDACRNSKVKVNDVSVKPSRVVVIGDLITLRKGPINYSYQVIDLLPNRVGAKMVSNFILNKTTAQDLEKLELLKLSYSKWRAKGLGRPTKKDRRDIDGFDKPLSAEITNWDDWDNWEDWEDLEEDLDS